jgi:flagellar biosynthesis/type III secretory pathway chaperone
MKSHDDVPWGELIANLREQRRHVHALTALAREQTFALAEANVQRLAEITQEQCLHLDEIDMLEQQREEITRRIGETMGLHAQPPTLSDYTVLAPPQIARTLQWLQRELLQNIRQLQELNERNRTLVQHAAETVNTWLALVTNAACNQASYHPQSPVGVAVIVNKEV